MTIQSVAVLGATGFVGSATVEALRLRGLTVIPVRAPRLPNILEGDASKYIDSHLQQLQDLVEQFAGVDAVINAAGKATATSDDSGSLIAANGVLPGLIAAACRAATITRFVHVSSAAVQGRRPVLDETWSYDDFSVYSRSKRLGEELVRQDDDGRSIIYRPPGVHGVDRSVTRLSARIAASKFSSVAKPASAPSPQALIQNVADAIAHLASTAQQPPHVVIHPSEGLTTGDVMTFLGGRQPLVLPRRLAQGFVSAVFAAGKMIPSLRGQARRVEMMWFGQPQATSWLEANGWTPPAGRDAWAALGTTIRTDKSSAETRRSTEE